MSVRLYVGNLPKGDVERDDLQTFFADAGELVSIKPIKDRKTGKCRGFAFVTVETDEQADRIVEQYNGTNFQEQPVKIEKALPKTNDRDDEEGDGDNEASSAPKPDRQKDGGNARRGGKKGGGGGRKDGNKAASGGSYSSASADSFQPDPRWAGQLAELKNKLAESGNP
jgi:RNA recognition motif-containing protein